MKTKTNQQTVAPKRYRYYSTSLSRHMLRSVSRHLPKIGAPQRVRALSAGGHGGWYELVVSGTAGKLVLRGCSWGYGGEGPHSTRDVLVSLGVSRSQADAAAFNTPNEAVGTPGAVNRVYFDIPLGPLPGEGRQS